MRKVFFLLLVVNLVFLAWQSYQHRAQRQADAPLFDDQGVPGLTLLRERERPEQRPAGATAKELAASEGRPGRLEDAAQGAAEPSGPPRERSDEAPDDPKPELLEPGIARSESAAAYAADPASSARICRELGPIADQQRARELAAVLAARGVPAQWREVQPATIDSYWVLAPPRETREKTRELVASLKERGVQDLWIMLRGELKGYISLGLYSREARAQQRQRQLTAYGVNAIIRPRFNEAPQYRLVLELPADPREENRLRQLVQGLRPDLALTPVNCSEIGDD